MNRSHVLGGIAATLAAGLPVFGRASELVGARLTQRELFAGLPAGKPGQWTRILLGSGAKYQKQIGIGMERDATGLLSYIETQTGVPGGACNPSSMRKAYLKDGRIGGLLDEYALLTNIGRTENFIYRYGDADSKPANPGDSTLRLLEENWLYDPRQLHVTSVAQERIHVASATHDTTRIEGSYGPVTAKGQRLRHIVLWTSPVFPFGVARYRATLAGLEPFEMHVYSHGRDFSTLLAMKLDEVRGLTKNGEYGQLPAPLM